MFNYQLIIGRWRYWYLTTYYSNLKAYNLFGLIFRFLHWWNETHKDKDMHGNKIWTFNINETVKTKRSKNIGLVVWRFIKNKQEIYEIKIGKHYYIFYKHELSKTNLRLFGQVKIEEIKFKNLNDGHFCQRTYQWKQMHFTQYVHH